MSKKKRFGVSQALSRGISETIHVVENNTGTYRNVILPLSRIELDPNNPRKMAITLLDIQKGIQKTDPLYPQKIQELEKLKELAFTIENSGVINPIVAYKKGEAYRIVAGERRCLASILANKLEIEARVFNDKPKGFELKLLQWVENTAREDLSLGERINNIREIVKAYQEQFSEGPLTATLLKNIIGLSLSQASYYVSVLNAPADVVEYIDKGLIRNLDKAAIISSIVAESIRREALEACMNGATLKTLRQIISKNKKASQALVPLGLKRGRASSRVNLGFTANPYVVQTIVETVLGRQEFQSQKQFFSKIQWAKFDETSKAFKRFLTILEQEIVK